MRRVGSCARRAGAVTVGMFDSLYDRDDNEWQTKAYTRSLDEFRVGDLLPDLLTGEPTDYQVDILGGDGPCRHSLATVRDNRLVAIDVERDPRLPLVDYGGGVAAE